MTDNEERAPAIDVQNQGDALKVHNLGLDLADGRHLLTNADMTAEEGRAGDAQRPVRQRQVDLGCGRWGICGPSGHGSIRLPGGAVSVPAAKALSAESARCVRR
jgi:putative ATP-binding cassette transporter